MDGWMDGWMDRLVNPLCNDGCGSHLSTFCLLYVFKADGSNTGQPIVQQASAHDSDVNSVAWNPSDYSLLASGGDDFNVKLWRLREAPPPQAGVDGQGAAEGGGGASMVP
jgi:hypothetical protein